MRNLWKILTIWFLRSYYKLEECLVSRFQFLLSWEEKLIHRYDQRLYSRLKILNHRWHAVGGGLKTSHVSIDNRSLRKSKWTSMLKAELKLDRESITKHFQGDSRLFLANTCLTLLRYGNAFPGKAPVHEIYEYVCQRLNIISTGMFNAHMSIDWCVTCSPN